MAYEEPVSDGSHRNELSARAGQVVQARDIEGGVHVHPSRESVMPRPQMLPPDVTFFTGRDAELGRLDAVLNTDTTPQPAAVVISAIAGTAGMGKTALAVRWAHRVRHQFPDGQLYVNLRSYDRGPPVTTHQALDNFLRALDVPGERIPHDVDVMAGVYRSLLADRRMLVILDNAATADQVRPLLPASSTCVVLVTSRNRLSGLVARDGAHRITLDLLPPAEAITLLRAIVGAARTDAEPDALADLARQCAYLPLALRIAAERLAARPHYQVPDLVADLTIEHNRLEVLAADDDETAAVRTVFSWSYHALSPEAARVFRLLGLHPGPEISVDAAAALTATATATATTAAMRRLLDVLAGAHLLTGVGPDRYAFHDLLRTYAAELVLGDEHTGERTVATERILSWYLHTAHAASRVLHPYQPPKPFDTADSDRQPLAFASHDKALGWFDAEYQNLMATVHRAAETGWYTVAWQLPIAMANFQSLRSRWADRIAANKIGLAAARYLHDPQAEYWALVCLGETYLGRERFNESIPYFERALGIATAAGFRNGEASVLHDLGRALYELARFDDALEHFQQALALYRETGYQRGEGVVLSLIGGTLRAQRKFDRALDYATKA